MNGIFRNRSSNLVNVAPTISSSGCHSLLSCTAPASIRIISSKFLRADRVDRLSVDRSTKLEAIRWLQMASLVQQACGGSSDSCQRGS